MARQQTPRNTAQSALPFTMQPRSPKSGFTRLPPRDISPSKRARVASGSNTQTLPPYQRSQAQWKAPALKPSHSYMFRGLHPLYTRHVVEERHHKMLIRCGQPNCEHEKEIDRTISGTNNYKVHYRNNHPGIPVSETEEREALKAQA